MTQTRLSSKRISPRFTGRDIINLEARKKKLEKSYLKTEQEEAFKEVIKVIGANGGRVPYGEMDKIVKAYHEAGCKGVTCSNLYYRLSQLKKTNPLIGTTLVLSTESAAVVSALTEDLSPESPFDPNNPDHIPSTPENDPTPEKAANIGGRAKGSTKSAVILAEQQQKDVITKCSIMFQAEKQKAKAVGCKVTTGTLQSRDGIL